MICTQVIERLCASSHILNKDGPYACYGRVGGCLVTGNEDGVSAELPLRRAVVGQ